MADETRPGSEEEVLQAAMSAGLLRELAGDREMFLRLLVQAMESSVPDHVEVDRAGGWFGRGRSVRALRVDMGDNRYTLQVGKGGALTATRTRVVRGIALRTDDLPVEAWLRELSTDLVEYGRTHEAALAALRRTVW